MNREELFAWIVAAGPGREETVYLERRSQDYDWQILGQSDLPADDRRA